MNEDELYLVHIGECIARVERYAAIGEQRFFADSMAQDAVIRNLQILAESTTRLSTETREKRPDVDWRAIAGFRNVLVHDYLEVDMRKVWRIVTADVPVLKAAVSELLKGLRAER